MRAPGFARRGDACRLHGSLRRPGVRGGPVPLRRQVGDIGLGRRAVQPPRRRRNGRGWQAAGPSRGRLRRRLVQQPDPEVHRERQPHHEVGNRRLRRGSVQPSLGRRHGPRRQRLRRRRAQQRIQKFSSNGDFITKWGTSGSGDGQFRTPVAVATDLGGNVYVADTGNDRVQVFSPSGDFLRKWGGHGSGNGRFDNPVGLAIDTSFKVYVADRDNERIQKFTSGGDYVAKWGTPGTGDGQFNQPVGVDTDTDGNVYVGDTFNDRVQKFTSSGTFLTKWGSSGSGNGQFDRPLGIATDAAGDVYVADRDNARIQKFTTSGADFVTKWGGAGPATGSRTVRAEGSRHGRRRQRLRRRGL